MAASALAPQVTLAHLHHCQSIPTTIIILCVYSPSQIIVVGKSLRDPVIFADKWYSDNIS